LQQPDEARADGTKAGDSDSQRFRHEEDRPDR
jgi:hypothetical protein